MMARRLLGPLPTMTQDKTSTGSFHKVTFRRGLSNSVYSLLPTPGTPSINTTIAETIDTLYEMRLETLLSVDDLVTEVVKTLEVSWCCFLTSDYMIICVTSLDRTKMSWITHTYFTTVIMVCVLNSGYHACFSIYCNMQATILDSLNNR